jgi:type I restriction enzyme S subunit
MSNEWFFEKFALIADAPGAVERIRELVLQMACSGQLSRGEIGKWKEVALGDVIELISGQHLLSHEHNAEQRGIPYLTGPSDFGEKHPEPTRWTEHPKVIAEPGDILITVKGSGVGKTNVLVGQKTAIGRQLMAIRTNSAAPDFLLILLKRAATQLQDAKTGIAIPGIGRREILGLKIPLPPLAEQKRIVAKVDELMGLCDELEAQQQERELRKSVLVRSSLSRFAESPTSENLGCLFHNSYDIPPSELRKSILTLAVQGLLVPHDSESVEWETRKLKDLATKIGSGSTPSGGKESYKESGVPLIRSMNIYFGGFVRQGLAFLNDEQAEKLKNVAVKADDVLLNITGASIGRVATAPRDMEGARVNQHVCIIRPTSEITPKFLELVLASPVVQNLIDAIQVGATREALTKAMIEQFEIPVPSLAEQHRIVAKVDQLMALVDELERQQAASREKASNLLDAIVHEMTSGG